MTGPIGQSRNRSRGCRAIAGLCTVDGDPVCVPDPHRVVHLQFRRCVIHPLLDPHLQWMLARHADVVAAGIHEVLIFRSTPHDIGAVGADLPIDTVADPDTRLYRKFGVPTSVRNASDPHGWASSLQNRSRRARGARLARSGPPLAGASAAPPAEFLIDNTGVALAAKYGRYIRDHWSVDELLALARAHR